MKVFHVFLVSFFIITFLSPTICESVIAFTIDLSHNQNLFENIFKNEKINLIPGRGESNIRVNVSRNTKYQSVLGFGACLSDSSSYLLNQMKIKNPEMYEQYIDRVFGILGINVLRIPVASNDYISTNEYYTYQDDESKSFSISHDQKYYLPVLRDITNLYNDTIIISSPWSSPGWMKNSRSIEGGSLEDYEKYSRYIKEYIKSYETEGVKIDFMTLQNEPFFSTANYPCMYLDQAKFVRYLLEDIISSSSLTKLPKLLIHDHNWDLVSDVETVIEGISTEFPDDFPVFGVAWHAYGGERTSQKEVIEKYPSLDLHTFFTEITAWEQTSDRKKNFHRDFRWALQNIVIGSTRNLAEVVVYFNLLLDENHGPTPRSDSLAFGLTTLLESKEIENNNNDDDDDVYIMIETELYALSHISSFIAPSSSSSSSWRIYSETYIDGKWMDIDSKSQEEKDKDPDGPLESIAFWKKNDDEDDDDGQQEIVVVVILNPSWMSEKTFDVVFDDGMFVSYTLPTESAVTFVRKYY